MSKKVSIQTIIEGEKYKLRWHEGGSHPSRTVNGSRRVAERRRQKIEDRLSAGIRDASKVKLNDVALAYFDDGKSGWSDKTLVGYMQQYNSNIGKDLGHLPLTDLRLPRLKRWRSKMAKTGVGQESQRKAITRLRAILNYAMDDELIADNPALRLKMPKPPVKKQIKFATATDVERARAIYLERGQRRDALIWSTLTYQLTRPGEVFGLRAKCIDLANAKLTIDARLTIELDDDDKDVGTIADGDKRHLSRVIDLHPSIVAEWREYLMSIGNPKGDTLVFPNDAGAPFTKSQYDSWRRNRFKRVAKLAGIDADVTPYSLRHTAVSIYLHCLGAGRLAFIARTAGHSQTMLLKTYSHEIDDLEDGWGLSVEQVIQKARAEVRDGQGRVMLG